VIKITIQRNKLKELVCIKAEGHSNYNKSGKDIVCAAVSTLLQLIEVGVKYYLKENIKINKTKAYFFISINRNISKIKEVDAIIEPVALFMKLMKKKYKNYISIEEKCMN